MEPSDAHSIVTVGGILRFSGAKLRMRQRGAERYLMKYLHRMNANPSSWALLAGTIAVVAYLAYLIGTGLTW